MAEGVATSMVGSVLDSLFGATIKQIGYMWNYTQNVEKFKKLLQDLKDMKGRVEQQIVIANAKGDNLKVGVQEWVNTAGVEISTAETFLEEEANANKTCFKFGMCGNWGTLYRYGKMATKNASSLLQHQESGKTFETGVSVYTPAPGPLEVFQNKNLDDLVTHKLALERVISAINDETKQIIGIYGLGGVGKTTLAKEVASKMKNHFDDVAFTTVSQSLNVEKVQKDIEDATKKIMQGKKILIILDDVWEKLDLEELRIPCGTNHSNCKILLTSRSEDVCNKMNAQSKICVDPLKKDETWILFKQVVGERIETDVTLKQVAMKVSEECGGLPLLVQAVGNALKDKSIHLWKSALTRLKEHAPLDIDPDIKKAYTHLKLSYDYLDSEKARSCFLLCSMFPEDEEIFLEDLVYYWVGLAKFNNLESVNDARDMVRIAVNILTSSGLLLNMDNENRTKMHDVVRDVALLIASEGNNKFLVKTSKSLSEWLPKYNTLESYTGISLMKNKICKLPDYEVHLPHLTTFLIANNKLSTISNEFIGGMKEVRAVAMSWNRISSLPQSLKLLTKVCMLDLRGNKSLHEISILGELKDLEILILSETGIKEIPQEIGQLVNLRRFDISNCKNLSHISEGVLSKLCGLEELCIGFYSMHGGIYGIMVEIMNLSKLTYLNLLVLCFDVIPEGFNWEKLKGFVIQIWRKRMSFFTSGSISERYLVLSTEGLKIPFVKSLKKLIEVNPNTVLESVHNLNNILPDVYHEGFNKLESIVLFKCPNVTSLVDTKDWDEFQTIDSSKAHLGNEGKTEQMFFTKLKHLELFVLVNLEVLWKCPDQYISLSNLVTLDISWCKKLVSVFSVNVAQGLVSLQELRINFCRNLEKVIWGGDDEETANIIVFPCLVKISLIGLKSLKSFYYGNSTVKYPSLVEVTIRDCGNMKKWGNKIQITPKLKSMNDVPILNEPDVINHAVVKLSKPDGTYQTTIRRSNWSDKRRLNRSSSDRVEPTPKLKSVNDVSILNEPDSINHAVMKLSESDETYQTTIRRSKWSDKRRLNRSSSDRVEPTPKL